MTIIQFTRANDDGRLTIHLPWIEEYFDYSYNHKLIETINFIIVAPFFITLYIFLKTTGLKL